MGAGPSACAPLHSPAVTAWDLRKDDELAGLRTAALRRQVVELVAPSSPFWRDRLAVLGRAPADVATPSGLAQLPAVGERDVCPDGDPRSAGALVLQAGEQDWALAAEGPRLREGLGRRLRGGGGYAAVVEADTRPTSFVWAGLGLRFPVASTRSDLDLVARAGARLWRVLGLTRDDVLVTGLTAEPTAVAQSLSLAALGAGAPALHPGPDPDRVAEALRLVPATVLALPAGDAARLLEDLDEVGAPLRTVRTLLLVGAPTDAERDRARVALSAAGGPGDVAVLAVHVPDGHRLAWGECRESGGSTGLHTYPDLEVLDVVDPESGDPARGPGELVLTQLGMRGSALLRWRTADLVEEVVEGTCPACRRNVPRAVGVRRRALVRDLDMRDGPVPVDLRAVSAALAGRPDVRDWRVVVAPSRRDGTDELLVHVEPSAGAEPAELAVGVARDVRAAAGLLPTQVVVAAPGQLPGGAHRIGRTVLPV